MNDEFDEQQPPVPDTPQPQPDAEKPPEPPGGTDAVAQPQPDESVTHVPQAVGLPTVEEAKQELADNPERASVLSNAGHVVRD